jgi:hypothetical protein
MLVYYIQKIPSPTHRSTLIAKIKRLGAKAMILCTLYMWARALYVFSKDSSKCFKCTYKRVIYNENFSKMDFNKLLEEKDHLKTT